MFDREDREGGVWRGLDGASGGGDAAPDWRQLDRQLRGVARRRAALDAEEARWLVLAQQVELHRRFGYASLHEYLERTLGYGPRAARERLRVASALQVLPRTAAALARGDQSYSAVRELTRVVREDTEGEWLDAAAGKTVHEIEALVAGRKPGDLPGDPVNPAEVRRVLSLEVSAETYALWRDARLALELERGEAVPDDELLRVLCLGMLAGEPGPASGGGKRGRAAYQIALMQCPDCERVTQDGGGRAVEVPATVVERARCDARVLGRVDGDGDVHVIAKPTQTIPAPVRAAVVARDHGRCRVPGCRAARWVEVHHVRPRAQGGPHTMANLVSLCGGHHDAVHVGRLRITRSASGEVVFTHADGRPYGAPPRTRDERDEPPTAAARVDRADAAHMDRSLAQRIERSTRPVTRR
ncbi:MAG: HNH endonuclease [Kofleriaceae bacterium]|nr:HNH endonuclease [Kofleriaceae bacterium]